MFTTKRLLLAGLIIFFSVIVSEVTAVQGHDHDEKPQNLKVLPKDMTGEEIHALMRDYCKSLNVRCNYCHAAKEIDGKKHIDFASDDNPLKDVARDMIRMTKDINEKYLPKIDGGKLEKITCVTCHMGNTKPLVSVDSLVK